MGKAVLGLTPLSLALIPQKAMDMVIATPSAIRRPLNTYSGGFLWIPIALVRY